jgi:hypothetical protein
MAALGAPTRSRRLARGSQASCGGRKRQLGDGRGNNSARPNRKAQLLEIVLRQVRQSIERNLVFGKHTGVSAEPEAL